jgi:transposase
MSRCFDNLLMGCGMVAVSITRTDLTAVELRAEAARSKNAKASRRMLAIAMALDGHSREAAAEACAMDRQTLRDWVLRYNEYGLPGLYDLAQPGPRPFLTAEQEAKVVTWVENGPDLEKDGVVRWRRVDLRDRIEGRFGVVFHERSVGKLLRRLNFRRISVRPRHPETDEGEQETFKKTSLLSCERRSRTPWRTKQSSSGTRMKHGLASKAL